MGITSTVVRELSVEIRRAFLAGAGVEIVVEFDPQRRQAAQCVTTDRGVVLADACGEGDDVGRAEHRQVRADVLAQPVDIYVVGQHRCLVTRRDSLVNGAEVDLAAETEDP